MQVAAPAVRALRSPQARRLRLGLLFVSPWIIGFCVFYLYPFLATLYYSFTSFTGIGNPRFTGLANYTGLLHDACSGPPSSTPSTTRSSRCRSPPWRRSGWRCC